jgi:hypothetical protein
MFCQKCGAQIPDGSTFCSSCGQPIPNANMQGQAVNNNPYGQQGYVQNVPNNYQQGYPMNNPQGYGAPNYAAQQPVYNNYGGAYGQGVAGNPMYVSVANKVKSTETAVNVCWIILGVLQIIIALAATNFIYVAIAGIWNIVNAAIFLKNANDIVAGNPNVVSYFDKRLTGLIVILVVNLFIGGFIGVILAVIELVNRNYVLNNRMAFEAK